MHNHEVTISLSSFCDTLKDTHNESCFSDPEELYYTIIPRNFKHSSEEKNLEYDPDEDYKVVGLESRYLNGLKVLTFNKESKLLTNEKGKIGGNNFTANGLYIEVIRLVTIFYKNGFKTLEDKIRTSLYQNDFNALKNKYSSLINKYQNEEFTLTNEQMTILILLHCFHKDCTLHIKKGVPDLRKTIFEKNQPNDIDEENSYENRFNKDFEGSLSPGYIIKKLVKLYLNNDDSQSKEKRSIYSHKKYVPSSTEEEETIADFKLIGQPIEAYINEIMNKDIPIEDKISLIDKFFKILYAIYPEFQDLKSQDLRGLEKENNEKNDRHR